MKPKKRRRLIIRMIALLSFVVLMTFNVGCYISLRNRSEREWGQTGMDGMLYVAVESLERTHDMSIHHSRARLFAPLNFIDRIFFGGDGPVLGILFELA